MLVVFGIALAGTWTATQWVAFSLGFQQRLGAPWFLIDGFPVYYPWRLFEWWYVYDAYAPGIFQTDGWIAGGGGIAAALSAIVGSVWRARQSKHITTYGLRALGGQTGRCSRRADDTIRRLPRADGRRLSAS